MDDPHLDDRGGGKAGFCAEAASQQAVSVVSPNAYRSFHRSVEVAGLYSFEAPVAHQLVSREGGEGFGFVVHAPCDERQ